MKRLLNIIIILILILSITVLICFHRAPTRFFRGLKDETEESVVRFAYKQYVYLPEEENSKDAGIKIGYVEDVLCLMDGRIYAIESEEKTISIVSFAIGGNDRQVHYTAVLPEQHGEHLDYRPRWTPSSCWDASYESMVDSGTIYLLCCETGNVVGYDIISDGIIENAVLPTYRYSIDYSHSSVNTSRGNTSFEYVDNETGTHRTVSLDEMSMHNNGIRAIMDVCRKRPLWQCEIRDVQIIEDRIYITVETITGWSTFETTYEWNPETDSYKCVCWFDLGDYADQYWICPYEKQ